MSSTNDASTTVAAAAKTTVTMPDPTSKSNESKVPYSSKYSRVLGVLGQHDGDRDEAQDQEGPAEPVRRCPRPEQGDPDGGHGETDDDHELPQVDRIADREGVGITARADEPGKPHADEERDPSTDRPDPGELPLLHAHDPP